MYATSSTKDSSLLDKVYFEALFQNVCSWNEFSMKVCSLNAYDYNPI